MVVCPLVVDIIEYADLVKFDPVSFLFRGRSSGELINLLVFDSALLSDTFLLCCALLLNDEAFSGRDAPSCCTSNIGLKTFWAKKKKQNCNLTSMIYISKTIKIIT